VSGTVRRIAILGSTGSIGTQTLEIVERFAEDFEVVGLAAGRNIELLIQQAKQFRPSRVSVTREEDLQPVRDGLSDLRCDVSTDARDVACSDADLVVAAFAGGAGLQPVLAALERGADVALANKEVLVMAGEYALSLARCRGARIVPVDSELVAIHQCLAGQQRQALRRVVLTGSGGPFRTAKPAQLATATPRDALAHPNWEMGAKITIDSATLMNKGFEVIEARWLFDLEPGQIEVLIHPESVVHSLVEYVDGSWLAQLGIPDMRVPISYALGMPDRFPLPDLPPLDLAALGSLHFEEPDLGRFPALRLAREALETGGTAPAMLSAVNEVAVEAFLDNRIPFTAIPTLVEAVLEAQPVRSGLDLEEILSSAREARDRAVSWIEERFR
jgi:1-deoxy-D-xylulose-5-phosphate reductoisomerase